MILLYVHSIYQLAIDPIYNLDETPYYKQKNPYTSKLVTS